MRTWVIECKLCGKNIDIEGKRPTKNYICKICRVIAILTGDKEYFEIKVISNKDQNTIYKYNHDANLDVEHEERERKRNT